MEDRPRETRHQLNQGFLSHHIFCSYLPRWLPELNNSPRIQLSESGNQFSEPDPFPYLIGAGKVAREPP
jgi:hypothetical protein